VAGRHADREGNGQAHRAGRTRRAGRDRDRDPQPEGRARGERQRDRDAAGTPIAIRAAASLALLLAGCAGTWDARALEAREPALAALAGHRLGDATPYLLPLGDRLIAFLCRFDAAAPIRVALPPDANPDERAWLERGLRALEPAVGVRFEEAGPAQIEIAFAADDARFAATTEAECRVEQAARVAEAATGSVLPARLVRARVALRRAGIDLRRHRVALDDAQQLGALIHELGHALGYQGHAARGDTVMVRTVERVRDVGRRVQRGEPLRDDTLAALYRVASGTVVVRAPLPPGRSAPVDQLAELAAREGDGSLWLRVGDRAGRVAVLLQPGDRVVKVVLGPLPEALRRPDRLVVTADPLMRTLETVR
jgi:hypothetical protein